jgi:hypothetical protein
MANQEQLEILKSGVENWNKWREKNPDEKINLISAKLQRLDLSFANLTSVKLSSANLNRANLTGANLKNAELIGSSLRKTELKNAVCTGADFRGAILSATNLSNSNFSDTLLNHAHFLRAILKGTKLTSSKLGLTTFSDVDLTNTNGLDSCFHYNNSYLDFHTLSKSIGLPLSFLRGCGLTDNFIKGLPSLNEQVKQFYKCFISYNKNDQEFADKLYDDLQIMGIRAWYAPQNIKAGMKIIDQIDEGINESDKLLLILSENSIDSEWVKTEIARAFKKSKEMSKQVFFPISLISFDRLKKWDYFDSDYGKDLAKEIREYYLPNFENWKNHEEYKKNFEKLVESLRIKSHY